MKKAEFYLYKGRFVSSYFNRTGFCNEIDYFRETKFFELRSHGQIPIRSNVSGIFLDHRTNYEVGNVQGVMDGDIDGFMESYLKMKL